MKSVGIIGFGRFGKVLYNILKKGYSIKVFEPRVEENDKDSSVAFLNEEFIGIEFVNWEAIVHEEVIFVAVPISHFESVIRKIAPTLSNQQTIIDVCSVKVYPSQIMEKYIPKKTGIIATHPLFGPDSYWGSQGSHQAKIVMYHQRNCQANKNKPKQYHIWKDFFKKQRLEVVEMTPEEHDRLAADTQGLTHYIGRFLKEYGIRKTAIDTHGFTDLLDLVEQTCNDTWELYIDLQKYNPFTKDMIEKINQSIAKLNQKTKIV